MIKVEESRERGVEITFHKLVYMYILFHIIIIKAIRSICKRFYRVFFFFLRRSYTCFVRSRGRGYNGRLYQRQLYRCTLQGTVCLLNNKCAFLKIFVWLLGIVNGNL